MRHCGFRERGAAGEKERARESRAGVAPAASVTDLSNRGVKAAIIISTASLRFRADERAEITRDFPNPLAQVALGGLNLLFAEILIY